MSCYCEKKMVLDGIGDWNCEENEQIIAKSAEEPTPDIFGVGVDECGFYVFSDTPAKEYYAKGYGQVDYGGSGSSFYPKYCPFCGKKLRDEIKVTFMY